MKSRDTPERIGIPNKHGNPLVAMVMLTRLGTEGGVAKKMIPKAPNAMQIQINFFDLDFIYSIAESVATTGLNTKLTDSGAEGHPNPYLIHSPLFGSVAG